MKQQHRHNLTALAALFAAMAIFPAGTAGHPSPRRDLMLQTVRPHGAPPPHPASVTHRDATPRTLPGHGASLTPPHPPALKAIFGPVTLPDGKSAFPVYHRLGVQTLELGLSWNRTAPTRPSEPTNPDDSAYHWPAELEGAIVQAARYHIAITLLVEGFPTWSNGGRESTWAPRDAMDYANFLTAASRRYPHVRRWMILDEVNSTRSFNPLPPGSPAGPELYAQLLQDAYGALKAVSPANMVIGGMTYSAGTISTHDFIAWMRLPDGRPPQMDYYGHNPYSVRFPALGKRSFSPLVCDIDDLGTLERQLQGIYGSSSSHVPKLWLSEFGIGNGPSPSFDYYVSRSVQARWVTAAYRVADALPYVAALGWYELLDDPPSSPSRLTEGLLTDTGVPKPDFYAYAAAP
jgi:hypothetical protein